MDSGDVPWQLGAIIPPANPAAKVSFAALRELSREEYEQARESASFLERLAAAAVYPQVVEAYQRLEEAMNRQATPERRVLELNRAARALGAIAGELSETLWRSAELDFEETNPQRAQIEAAITEETNHPTFQLLVAVHTLDIGPFRVQDAGLALEPAALTRLAATIEGIGPELDLMASLFNGVVVAQRLIGRQLQAYAELIASHSLRLRQLAVEVPDGGPCLVRWRPVETDATGKPTFTIDQVILPLDKGALLHRALSFTEQMLRSSSGIQIRSVIQPASDTHPPGLPANSGPVGARDEAVPPTEDARELDDRALDVVALARHATEFCNELELAWSRALDHVLLAEAQQETQARHASLLAAIQRHARVCDSALREAGVDPGLPAFPTPPHEAARYTYDADRDQHVLQARLAELDALVQLLEAFNAMREPSGQRFFFDERAAETWWEAGAFNIVRERVAHLTRMVENTAKLLGTDSEPAGSPPLGGLFDEMNAANGAYGRGDMGATVMHVRLAIFQLAGASQSNLPCDLLELVAQQMPRADHANALRLLEVAAQRTAKGTLPDIATTALLAPLALATLGELLRDPQILRVALTEGSSHGQEA